MKLVKILSLVGLVVTIHDGFAANTGKSNNTTNQTSSSYTPSAQKVEDCKKDNSRFAPEDRHCKNFLICLNTGANSKNKENNCRVKYLRDKEDLI